MLKFTLINPIEGKQCPSIRKPALSPQCKCTINHEYILFTSKDNIKNKTEILSKWLIDVKVSINNTKATKDLKPDIDDHDKGTNEATAPNLSLHNDNHVKNKKPFKIKFITKQ